MQLLIHGEKKMIWWCRQKNKPCSMANENGYCQITACCNTSIPTVEAIPIEVFYKMIHNALADTKKENWEPGECPYDYFDGNRNAIHCMLDILCGDKDGDHDKFWEDYSRWEEENE